MPDANDPQPALNRLARETSPYLQQHAANPVDWYPWGPEALELARTLDRPIFLSIGYSACHWCHVMAHESFENDEIAEIMNVAFVNIKVDREERPDIDQIYMNAVVAATGHGGWPMSVFLTPEQEPFFAGTYWPPVSQGRHHGFREVLRTIQQAWKANRSELQDRATQLTEAVRQACEPIGGGDLLDEGILSKAGQTLIRSFDPVHGGFGHAPKFPHPLDLRLALRLARRFDADELRAVSSVTLDRMARGGIYDHLGGGFARYSTDDRWLVPHFEKMLYDSALLIPCYLEAWQATKKPDFLTTVRETLEYVLREMTRPGGGFYSAQDADSEGEEGKFFVWSAEEVDAVLGPVAGPRFRRVYDVTPEGNWEGQNILNRPLNWSHLSTQMGVAIPDLQREMADARAKLFAHRSRRVSPGRDEKILTSWNGLMIAAMARAGFILNVPRYLGAARAAAEFVWTSLRDQQGRLLHTFKGGRAHLAGCLDDYACYIDGLLELAQADAEPQWVARAEELARDMITRFGAEEKGFYYTAADHESLIARNRDAQDGATPSGNNAAAMALLKLARLTGNREYVGPAWGALEMASGLMTRAPLGAGMGLLALDFALDPTYEFVLFETDSPETAAVLDLLRTTFLPNHVLVRTTAGRAADWGTLTRGREPMDGLPTLFVCQEGACQLPVAGRVAIQFAIEQLVSRDSRASE